MKKHTVYKTIQLVLLLVLAATVILYIFPRADVYHAVANDPTVRLLAIVVWAVFIISFIFLYLDYPINLKYSLKLIFLNLIPLLKQQFYLAECLNLCFLSFGICRSRKLYSLFHVRSCSLWICQKKILL